MRRKRTEENQKAAHRCQWNRFSTSECVYENHHLRNCRVKRKRLDVFRDFLDGCMGHLLLRLVRLALFDFGGQFPLACLILSHE